jgi:hypothetical protein
LPITGTPAHGCASDAAKWGSAAMVAEFTHHLDAAGQLGRGWSLCVSQRPCEFAALGLRRELIEVEQPV